MRFQLDVHGFDCQLEVHEVHGSIADLCLGVIAGLMHMTVQL